MKKIASVKNLFERKNNMKCKDVLILDEITSSSEVTEVIQSIETECISEITGLNSEAKKEYKIEHALDSEMIDSLKKLCENGDTDYEFFLFKKGEKVAAIWSLLLEKSIKCLRFFDTREPFIKNEKKHPIAYGVDELSDYFLKFSEFEKMLYGGAKYYRDHIIHVFRVWMLGISTLLKNKAEFLDKIVIDKNFNFNALEKLSIWTIIALTHDLGYPLEKSQEIVEKTKEMMKCFIQTPKLSMDLSFNGVQNNMNDFVLRFISSKMNKKVFPCVGGNIADEQSDCTYVARLQPKYYFKFQKSLEKFKHGTISAIIIYKMLLFF